MITVYSSQAREFLTALQATSSRSPSHETQHSGHSADCEPSRMPIKNFNFNARNRGGMGTAKVTTPAPESGGCSHSTASFVTPSHVASSALTSMPDLSRSALTLPRQTPEQNQSSTSRPLSSRHSEAIAYRRTLTKPAHRSTAGPDQSTPRARTWHKPFYHIR